MCRNPRDARRCLYVSGSSGSVGPTPEWCRSQRGDPLSGGWEPIRLAVAFSRAASMAASVSDAITSCPRHHFVQDTQEEPCSKTRPSSCCPHGPPCRPVPAVPAGKGGRGGGAPPPPPRGRSSTRRGRKALY